ncbi:LPD29 domain-containing protein [Streptomyces anulatus]|uniref:LPD29 domain-containing protein n=1 Tax=Streptomyces anulatus TaxID=1892 RepID=UPI0036AEEEDD
MTTYIDARHVSAELKRRLTAEFPGVKFSVRRGRGTGSASIDVTWTDGPAARDVAAIANPMRGSTWNGYDERYESTATEVTVTIDGERVTGKPVVEHMGVHHEVSDEVRAEARAMWLAANPDEEPEMTNGGFTCEGEFIGGSWGVNQILDIAERVILPRRWRAAREAAAAPASKSTVPAEPATALPGPGLDVTHTEGEGIVVRGTRRGDGSAPALRAQELKWHRKEGYWYLPGTRGAAGAARLGVVREALRAAELLPAAPTAPSGGSEGAATAVAQIEESAPAVEEVAGESDEGPRGLECGAHRVTGTGERQPHGAGAAYLFRCLTCGQRALLADFDGLKCAKEAEAEHARARVDRLLDHVTLRGASTYLITYALAKGPFRRTRGEAVEELGRLLVLGATPRWHAGELRLLHHDCRVASVIRAPGEPLAARTAPQAYRCVPVPEEFAADWDGAACLAWRDGVDAALTYAVLAQSGG